MTETNAYTQSPWSLKDLFNGFDDANIDATYQQMEALITNFEAYRAELQAGIPTERFLVIIHAMETLEKLGYRLYGFAELSFAANTQDQKAQIAIARVQQFIADAENRTLFFSLWWKALDNENASRLLAASGDYRYWLEQIRNFKPYTLSEPEEKVVNIKNVTGNSALNMLYDSITNRYTFKITIAGEEKELTRGELMVLARSDDADLRAQAYQELYRVYGHDAPILGQIYQNLVRDWRNENVSLRGFKSPISVRNQVNDLPDTVIETLLDVSRKNIGIFHRYFQLKAKKLGIEKLRRYDIYAPVSKSDKRFSFQQGIDLTFEAFERFDGKFARLAKRVFDEQHVDSEVRKGKMGGAFCSTLLPELTPWVLLNYQGKADDVSTMAHELGHAIHSMMAENHSLFTQHACLPLAETASTFGEMTLTDLLLERESDPSVKQDLLFRQLDDAFATILRQVYFALFERQAHEMIVKDASVDELSEAYLANLKEEFGNAVDVSDEFKYEWVSIPHIYGTPFYVYAYAFGQLLVFALYQLYKKEGEAFKPKYMRILSAGGSIAPIALLAEAGLDVTMPEFWQGGYDVINEMVNRLEAL
ncbi:MAG TPA: M3 family oligoendopeptidase [Anaerolineaceae bacterium]|nr:M3 family oligoendopeptidase [Anaerolineaceae bacterium]HPT24500.1 M3 family oligoendopeptidase [Anaerolineaceae bacterium]